MCRKLHPNPSDRRGGRGAAGARIVAPPQKANSYHKFFRDQGLYTIVRWNYFFTNPPLPITEAELREGFAIIDKALDIADQAVT